MLRSTKFLLHRPQYLPSILPNRGLLQVPPSLQNGWNRKSFHPWTEQGASDQGMEFRISRRSFGGVTGPRHLVDPARPEFDAVRFLSWGRQQIFPSFVSVSKVLFFTGMDGWMDDDEDFDFMSSCCFV